MDSLISKTVLIKTTRWEIREEGDEGGHVFQASTGTNRFCLGLCDNSRQIIYIHTCLQPEQKRLTLRHELTHAILFTYGFNSNDSFTDEDVCEIMSIYGREIDRLEKEYFDD